jgi:hypothetical protein
MTFEAFRESAANSLAAQPKGLSPALLALWHDAHGDWPRAHASVQNEPSRDGAWVHAYLHRKEGDESNARYWYVCAGKPVPSTPLAQEWSDMAQALWQTAVSEKNSTGRVAAR